MQPQTLKFKLVLYLTIALTVAMLLFTSAVAWFLHNEIVNTVSDHVTELSEVIVRSLRFAMLQNDPFYTDRIIHDVASQKGIDLVRSRKRCRKDYLFDLPAGDRPDGGR